MAADAVLGEKCTMRLCVSGRNRCSTVRCRLRRRRRLRRRDAGGRSRLREQHRRAGTGEGGSRKKPGHCGRHCAACDFFSSSAFDAVAGGSGGGTGAGSLGPSFIKSRNVAMTSSRESRRGRHTRESLLLPGGGGGSGFSASSSG